MEPKSPRAGKGARARKSHASDNSGLIKNRRILQASPAAKLRLEAILWAGWLTLGGVRP